MSFKYRKPGAVRRRVDVPAGLTDREALFDVLAAGLPLPDYFGRNWDALDECLSDLSFVDADIVELVHGDVPALPGDGTQTYLSVLADAVAEADQRGGAPELEVSFPPGVRAAIEKLSA